METRNFFRIRTGMIMALALLILSVPGCCQEKKPAQPQKQPASKAITQEDAAGIKKILSGYNASSLTAADARAIQEKFRDAGIHAGPETSQAIKDAGFDPEKLRSLAPPPGQGDKSAANAPASDNKVKEIIEKVCKPLALTQAQTEAVAKAFKDFYSEAEKLRKTQADPGTPIDKSKIGPLEESRDAKIKQVLTAEKYARYLELEKASRPQKAGDNPSKK